MEFHELNSESRYENVCAKDVSQLENVNHLIDEAKKLWTTTTFETGLDCGCKRSECFKIILVEERSYLIKQFNDIYHEGGYTAQNS